ncbi:MULTISPECIES: HD domain-containing phosphohydrolase [unclassified Halomonas]|jgi:c-di-GMP-binding flagellar brake protein YcgR|uniref:HD domain-containing phosphohydrolase n=1 Tax=unclassified Halomonas TaxID=2609666 RepID=UPI000A2891C6|nr:MULTISPECIES: HD domain-containing phosphohydrolase [unclassified Halomonas]MCO7247801.1 PilZ domain-containing protein [Halomonas sp. Mc5H-6]QPL46329.1 PilZ domain-containing protein [Halomonas sp. A40-4]
MVALEEEYERVANPVAVASLLDTLVESGGASLCLEGDDRRPEPVVLMEQHKGETLVLDLSSVDYLLGRLQQGEAFYLVGETQGKVLRTPLLSLTETRRSGGRFLCCSDYPSYLDVLQRREAFRAELRIGMPVAANVSMPGQEAIHGELRDLSQQGCQLELPMTASGMLSTAEGPLDIAFEFPDGTHFEIQALARHQRPDPERNLLRVGFYFGSCSADQERQVWYFVCEIERESARYAKEDREGRQPSPLFTSPAGRVGAGEHVGRRDVKRYATPMARRLVKVAAFLDGQMLSLQQGSDIDSRQLSLYADRLMGLHEEDRESLLFACRCLSPEPLLVRHGIAVAVHLLDLVGAGMPRDVRKAVVASGLVHDLGKALVPQVLFKAAHFEATHRQALSEHVSLVLERLESCQWLSQSVASAVIGGINERMDGSGYPDGVSGESLNELAKASAIVDVAEALRRDRSDRPAKTAQQIYRHLLTHSQQFDPHWIKRYVGHFKSLPVGALVRFSSEQLAWVLRIDEEGDLTEVQLATSANAPMRDNLGETIRGNVVEKLGRPVSEVAVST